MSRMAAAQVSVWALLLGFSSACSDRIGTCDEACVAASGGDDGAGDGADGQGGTSGADGGSADGSGDGDGSSGGGSGSGDDGDSGGDGAVGCYGGVAFATFGVEFPYLPQPPTDLDWDCEAQGHSVGSPNIRVQNLSCTIEGGGQVLVELHFWGDPLIEPDMVFEERVRLQYGAQGPMAAERWFRVDRLDGQHIVSGVDASSLTGPVGPDPVFPYPVETIDRGCGVADDACGLRLDLDVVVETPAGAQHVGPAAFTKLEDGSDTGVWVGDNYSLEDTTCPEASERRHVVLMARNRT